MAINKLRRKQILKWVRYRKQLRQKIAQSASTSNHQKTGKGLQDLGREPSDPRRDRIKGEVVEGGCRSCSNS